MAWIWLNIGVCAPIFLAVAGIPLWMVIRHPDTSPAFATHSAHGGLASTKTPSVACLTRGPVSETAEVSQRVAA
jgi:hypothetical protein